MLKPGATSRRQGIRLERRKKWRVKKIALRKRKKMQIKIGLLDMTISNKNQSSRHERNNGLRWNSSYTKLKVMPLF